jgi:hypothetical protein
LTTSFAVRLPPTLLEKVFIHFAKQESSNMNIQNSFSEYIYSYSRRQAIEDGVLVDLTQWEIIRKHWKIHMACTDTVWNIIDAAVKQHGKDLAGVLHDISMMAKIQIPHQNGDTLHFQCIVGPVKHDFKLHCGPGDGPIPVLTLMLPHED